MSYDEDHADEEWIEDEGDPEDDLLVCPSCHENVHEDTQQCPHCGDWIIPAYPHDRSKRLIWLVVVILVVFSLAAWTVC